MILRYLLYIVFACSISFCNNKSFKSYNDLISAYPEFISTNFFEDSGNYYFIKIFDLNEIKLSKRSKVANFKNQSSKARLSTLSDLLHSICCGFDISLLNKTKQSYDFEVDAEISEMNNIDVLLNVQYNNKLIYAIKASNDALTFISNCDCKIKTN